MSDACRFIHDLAGNFDRHKFPFEPERIPESGIYLLFEAGETATELTESLRSERTRESGGSGQGSGNTIVPTRTGAY